LADHYRGFNLVTLGDRTFAVPSTAGPVDLATESGRRRTDVLQGRSLEEARARVDRVVGDAPSGTGCSTTAPPTLVVEGYRRFNIVRWDGRYYAIPQGEGAFDPVRFRHRHYSRSFVGDSEQSLFNALDANQERGDRRSVFRLPFELARRVIDRIHR
jgi:hypothetical protein